MRRSDREVAAIKDIEDIISRCDVCRISMANDNIPYLVTLNFGYVNEPSGMLYFHCANEGRKLRMILQNNYVCFEMDTDHVLSTGNTACDWGMKYSSVVGYGNINIVTDKEERLEGMNSIMAHYGGLIKSVFDENVMQHTTILRLNILEMTGKRK
jgi:uncharacterized protein